ncbi:putative ATP-dependent RNA helicase SoYb [Uranotaenia lowii]|uniref:putative ATP-dependent RNA helicase SoYb n=1 Tax=Uranotaenia lowii TaxID=190385 RepID=UPI002478FE45|nr:putative ATP-dependent RNA helicase SoYb [Uranotaenia lowii]
MEDDTIRITHYINPHMFWYKPVSAYVHNMDEKRFQLSIDEYCETHFRQVNDERNYEAFPGETVAVLDFDRNKWCRCVVDGILEDDGGDKLYNLWSIDDGVPIQSSYRYVNPLPEKFSSEAISKVKRGAIKNVLPSEWVYDYQEDRLMSKVASRWDDNAIQVLHSIIQNSSKIYFRSVTRHRVHNVMINFGDLEIVTRKNKVFSAAHVLKKIREKVSEVEPRDFFSKLLEINTTNGVRSLPDRDTGRSLKNHIISHDPSPMKPNKTCNDSKHLEKESNHAKQNGINVRELEKNGVHEEDFDESASMIQPYNARVQTNYQPKQDPVIEVSNSDEELYPISSSMVKAGRNAAFEKNLWQQKTKPPSNDSFERIKSKELPKRNSYDRDSSNSSSVRNDDMSDVPKSTSFLSKLEMRKKLRAAQKSSVLSVPKEQPMEELETKVTTLNIVPAGFSMSKIAFENGKVVAGDSTDYSERKSKNKSPNFKLRSNNTSSSYSTANGRSQENGYDTGNDSRKVYVTKNNSRFDQLIEDEACVRSSLCYHRVLVHGKRIPKPVDRLEAANFCPEVHRELSLLNFGSIHRIQAYAWPHILRGNSFFCVNAALTGKTFSYLPAICSEVMKMHDEDLVKSGPGPTVIIISKSSREVQRVASYCKKMLNSSVNKSMAVVEACGARDIPKACNLLLNGCAVLVATAPAFKRIFESMPNALVKERIMAVVIDNIDMIIERFGSELQLLCKVCDKPELQMVVTATYWNPMFTGFLKRYKNMIICIGAYLEAAAYGKSTITLKLNTEEMKMHNILTFMKENNYQNERTLVVCSEPVEVYNVVEQLKSQSITHMFCNDKTTLTKMNGFKEWDNQLAGEMHVMVCYDDILPELEISKAQHIIHYSLPSSWTKFTRRFACSFGYYQDPFRDDCIVQQKPSSSVILLDENNNEQLPKLVEFLRIHNHDVAGPVLKLANNIRIQQEEQKLAVGNQIDFCSQVLEFGKCRTTGCTKRHVFTTNDLRIDSIVPTCGIIKMKIYNLFSPTYYTVRILEHRDYGEKQWNKVNDPQKFLELDLEMQQHFSNEDRHCNHGEVHYNDWCAIHDEHRYWRCRIISIDQKKLENSISKKVKVKLLDVGRAIDCLSSELLHLPKDFCRLPPQAIDIRIVGVVPHDLETDWDKRVTHTIREWVQKYTANDRFHVEGKVMLAIRDTVWVDTIRLVEHLEGINTELHEIHVKSEIVGKNFGVTDKEPLELLTKMVEACEMYRDRNNGPSPKPEDFDQQVDEEDKAHVSEIDSTESDEFFRLKSKENTDKSKTKKKVIVPIEITDDSDASVPVLNDMSRVSASTSEKSKIDEPDPIIQVQRRKICEFYEGLEEGATYEVYVSQYYGPDDFYVCKIDKFSSIASAIKEFTENETNLVPLKTVEVGEYCLVLYDSAYQRTKIVDVEGQNARVFFLDIGGYETYGSIDLFELPDDVLKTAAFCAIKAKFACIQPREEKNGWDPEVSDRIYDEVLADYRTFNAKVIETLPDNPVDTFVNCKFYRLLLFDPNQELESWIFDEIVELKLARYIEDERPYSVDINFGDDDFRRLLDPNYDPSRKPADSGSDSEARIEEYIEPTPVVVEPAAVEPRKPPTKLSLLKQRLRRRKSAHAKSYPRLKSEFRSPKTMWRQDNSLIVIRISAPENVRYDLEMDSESLKLCYVEDDEKYLLSIIFFAAIIPELVVHEVRGLSIVVRVVKLVQSLQWPSLMRNGDKVPWLQQCMEVSNSDETDGFEGTYRGMPSVPNLDSTDSVSDEPDYSEHYDRFDPIDDDYFLRED